jgi:hypothetical protein
MALAYGYAGFAPTKWQAFPAAGKIAGSNGLAEQWPAFRPPIVDEAKLANELLCALTLPGRPEANRFSKQAIPVKTAPSFKFNLQVNSASER